MDRWTFSKIYTHWPVYLVQLMVNNWLVLQQVVLATSTCLNAYILHVCVCARNRTDVPYKVAGECIGAIQINMGTKE